MPFNIGFTGLAILVLIGLLLFGPSKLPRLARAFGATIKEFRRGSKEVLEEVSPGEDTVFMESIRNTGENRGIHRE
ncbi:twin-arginine translocase TatA/TatE family subunit [Paenibacillus lautus]|uniref:Sec-independent protein translocase protein TatA n=1 Tax=Paenibacillus lautus TaxID=1401 RepID=A0A385TT18_PAELA|nr:twin-arginine translocase TatA/TatE family subunit [Paenibacillus lautus]AYB44255.1 twin-arginine translocase TatA/TatE family subunit [Paenibacillus lautus]MBY0161847.1 twin-arginine translocase TatA/TatE family subunit [Cytobacillus firmus]